MSKMLILLLYITWQWYLPSNAQDNQKTSTTEDLKAGRAPLTAVSPIFGELVSFSMPGNFKTVAEQTKGGNFYIREAVLRDETVNRWTQMITVTGAKGAAGNPGLNPRKGADQISAGFKRACPTTFSEKEVGVLTISGHDAYADLVSCGTAQNGGYAHSETALLIIVKGTEDYYTLQWAERGAPIDASVDLRDAKWQDRLKMLDPSFIPR